MSSVEQWQRESITIRLLRSKLSARRSLIVAAAIKGSGAINSAVGRAKGGHLLAGVRAPAKAILLLRSYP